MAWSPSSSGQLYQCYDAPALARWLRGGKRELPDRNRPDGPTPPCHRRGADRVRGRGEEEEEEEEEEEVDFNDDAVCVGNPALDGGPLSGGLRLTRTCCASWRPGSRVGRTFLSIL